MSEVRLATIGYEGTTIGAVVETLLTAGVQHLIDVRAVPLSRKPGFSKRQLEASLQTAGVRYSSLRGLGTPRAGRDAARRGDTATMRRIFAAHLCQDAAQADLALARTIVAQARSCLLCFEHDPHKCHRLPVALALGVPTDHLFCAFNDPPARPRRRRVSASVEPL